MNEFGETPTIYIWPKDHEEGTEYPADFWDKLRRALASEGIEWENAR